MKKVSVVFSLVLLASLVLAACGGNNGAEGTPGALGTPGAFGTSDAGTIPNAGETPGVVSSPTVMATEPVVATATTSGGAAVGTSTPAAGGTTSTPAAGASTTGTPVADLGTSPDRLSALLDYEVRNSAGEVIGKINGVLVNRNKVVSEDMTDNSTGNDTSGTGTTGTSTPAAGAGAGTSTPAVGSGSGTGMGTGTAMSEPQGGAQITYFVVELSTAFDETGTTGGTGSTGGTGTSTTPAAGSGTGTATPAAGATSAVPSTTQTTTGLAGDDDGMLGAGDEVLLPYSAFESFMVGDTMTADDSDTPALTLTVDDQVLAGAPVFDRDSIDFVAETWDEEFQAYWSGQNLTIPVTGEGDDTAAGFETVLLDETFEGINVVNTNDEDLGEVEDFILDTQSGQFRYAILATGGFLGLGEKLIPVPMEMVYWTVDDDTVQDPGEREVDDVGEILINVPEDAFENAPAFDSLDELDTSVTDWDSDITSFWQTYGPGMNQ